jgi:hypothetical protein
VCGSLAGHRTAYTARSGDFVQPRRLRPVHADAWWSYDGPLAVVFTGLADGTLVLPVRLPTAPSNQRILDHHLADPSRWHKVDLVRQQDPNALGGWRYEAHLMVLTTPYVSPSVAARRAKVAIEAMGRTAGVDVNVSNVTVASHEGGCAMAVTRIARDATQDRRDRCRSRRERRRQRALDRSRRAMNRAQYQLSRRQDKRARRRAAAGLPPVDVVPMGPRHARADGVPLQSYRRDPLSASYRRGRAAQAADAAGAAGRGRPRRHPRLPADRRGCEHLRVVALVGPRGRGVLAGPADGRTRSRGSRRGDGRWRPWRRAARSDSHDRAVAALPVRRTGHQAPGRTRASLPGVFAARRPRCRGRRARVVRRVRCARRAQFSAGRPRRRSRCATPDPACAFDSLFLSWGWQDTPSESTDLSTRKGGP